MEKKQHLQVTSVYKAQDWHIQYMQKKSDLYVGKYGTCAKSNLQHMKLKPLRGVIKRRKQKLDLFPSAKLCNSTPKDLPS